MNPVPDRRTNHEIERARYSGGVRRLVLVGLSVALLIAVATGVAQASSATRASKSVAGVRATLDQWANYVLTDQPKAACAMLTAHGQAVWAKDNGLTNCITATKDDYGFLKKYPSDAKAIRDYGKTTKVTLKGTKATMPKLGGGTRTLLYLKGLWYIDS